MVCWLVVAAGKPGRLASERELFRVTFSMHSHEQLSDHSFFGNEKLFEALLVPEDLLV